MNEEKNGVNPGNAAVTPTCHNIHHVQVEPAQTPGKTVTERVVERDGGRYHVVAVTTTRAGVVLAAPDYAWSCGGFGGSVSREWVHSRLSMDGVGTKLDRVNLAELLVEVLDQHHGRRS